MNLRRLLPAILLAIAPMAHSQADSFRLVVNYDRPGLPVPHWQITIPPRGAAEYTGKPEKGIDPGTVQFSLSPAGREKLGSLLARSNGLHPCETRAKGIANMGAKTVDYTPSSGEAAHCTFNFTENKALSDVMDYMIAVSATLQTGLELDRLHRYDRLGLDTVMVRLVADVKEGRATEIGAIKPTLQSLVSDEAVLERVRTRAQQLLDMVKDQEMAQR